MLKKEMEVKSVHRFTENAVMKFRPIHYSTRIVPTTQNNQSVVDKFSQMFGSLFGKSKAPSKQEESKNKTFSKSTVLPDSPERKNKSYSKSVVMGESGEGKAKGRGKSSVVTEDKEPVVEENTLCFLEKITVDTFLIGNQQQLDLITISGIYDNVIDTEINWSLNLQKRISKLAVDTKSTPICHLECYLVMEVERDIVVYRFDSKRLRSPPIFTVSTRLLGDARFLIFLKDGQFVVCYESSASVYQIEDNYTIRMIFNKRYGVGEKLKLFQVPRPVENTLNIFFVQGSQITTTYVLWRLELELKTLSANHGFKSIVRIYDIPAGLLVNDRCKIDNFSKEVIIINFQFEILAARDGFIVDTANINIKEDGSCLVYQGDHLLHVSDSKLFIYGFRILTGVKPNKIELSSLDSIEICKDARFRFFSCLEMLNGNFVLFFQVKPECNNKLKGEIDYLVTVTQKLSIQEKLNEIFCFNSPQQLKEITERDFSVIEEKCDMAFKIGLSRKQIYLQLWNKSAKKDISDYKFLLDTMDYDTIKAEIEKKLKKASMSFNEVFKIEQACFEMLRADLFGNSNCGEKAIKDYLISHFLLRKLTYFRSTHSNNPACLRATPDDPESKTFVIDIQQYVHTVKLDLKSHFIEYVGRLSIREPALQDVENFRIFLREFRFPLRILYAQLLETVILQAGSHLLHFLKAVPEILPWETTEAEEGHEGVGLWRAIEAEEWGKNLHIEEISTIYNKDYVEEITKTIWFKRNQNSLHDLVALSKQKILEVQEFNQSDGIFYLFIEKLFQRSRAEEGELRRVVDYLETNYARLPAHLKSKIFLYRRLWSYFQGQRHPQLTSFNAFLKLRDHQLFKELFRYEKVKKGCLLKDAKQIYQAVPNGVELYHQGLLNYFASDLSQISDLKYILNRLNNQKRQFHIQNEGIYVVLVRAMQMKLKLGSDNDIPLDEVMIYIQNIPLSKDNPVIDHLKTVERINEESDRFKKMKLNMSLLQIIENCEDVVTALINEEIREKGVLELTDRQALIDTTYGILAEVQTIKDKIYKGKYSDLPYFIYLSKLLQNQRLIPDVGLLLTDQYLLEYYCVDDRLIENLVLYMYKWKFNQEPTFVKNHPYLTALLQLLPEHSQCRRYIEAEIEFALMLSTSTFPIQYPLTQSETISIEEIAAIVNNLSAAEVRALQVERLHQVVQRMQELCVEMEVTSLQEIYQVCIMRLIGLSSVTDAIPLIRRLISIYGTSENYAVVFCYLVTGAILNEMPDMHRRGLLRIAFYTFDQPLLLLDVVQSRLQSKFSNQEEQAFLDQQLEAVRHLPCFRADNPLLDQDLRQKVAENKEKYYHKVEDLVFQTWLHLNSNREDFQRCYDYSFYYIILLHNPYALAKYLSLCPHLVNLRLLRSYLSYVFKEDIFHGLNVLYYGRRIFMVALEAALTLLPIEVIASQFKGNDPQIDEDQLEMDLDDSPIEDPASFAAKLRKSIDTFNSKIASYKGPKVEQVSKKKKKVEALLSSQASIQDNDASEYPFNDSDDNYDELHQQQPQRHQHALSKRKPDWHFDPNKERKLIMEREGKNVALYLSSAGVEEEAAHKNSSLLKSTKTFHHAFHSVRLPGKKLRKSSEIMHKNPFDMIQRTDSLGLKEDGNEGGLNREQDLMLSQDQQELFKSAQPNFFRPPTESIFFKTYSPARSPYAEAEEVVSSPLKLQTKNSVVAVNIEGEEEGCYDSGWRVNVQEIDDEQYTSVQLLKKQLLADTNEGDTTFDLSLIAKEEERELGGFEQYLRELISCIYTDRTVPLSLLLQLIKQIRTAYPQAGVSPEFLEYYVALENYNQKYKSEYLIREMFPADALFLPSKDPIALFQAVKQNILEVASYDRIVVIAQLLTAVLRKPEIKDDLYLSYLAKEIELYGNDSSSSELELKMQRERIEGMLPQITTSKLLLERAESVLRPIATSSRAKEVAEMIRESLRKKKKDFLIWDFDKNIASLNL